MLGAVILNYNDSETTKTLLNRIGNYNCLNHIVIVDNNSSDDSFEKLQSYASNKVDIIRTLKNGGYGYGNNYGICYLLNKYNVEYILILNPDVIVEEHTIIELLSFLKKHENYAMVSPVMLNSVGIKQKNSGWNIPSVNDYVFSMGLVYSILKKPGIINDLFDNESEYRDVDCITGSLFLVKSSHFSKFGMYDEEIFLYCEETVLGFKFKKANLKSAVLLNESYIHNHSVSIKKEYRSAAARRKLLIKSRLYVLTNYYNVNRFKYSLAVVLSRISVLEAGLLGLIGK